MNSFNVKSNFETLSIENQSFPFSASFPRCSTFEPFWKFETGTENDFYNYKGSSDRLDMVESKFFFRRID